MSLSSSTQTKSYSDNKSQLNPLFGININPNADESDLAWIRPLGHF